MFCTQCGNQNSDDAAFCTGCGQALSATVAPVAPSPQAAPQPEVIPPAVVTATPAPAGMTTQPMSLPTRRPTLWLSLAFAGVLLAGGGGFAAWQATYRPPASKEHAAQPTQQSSQVPQIKPTIAVLNFETTNVSRDLGTMVAELLTTALVETGQCDVIERGMLEKLIEEQRMQTTVVDANQAASLGKQAGADMVALGRVMKLGDAYTITLRFVGVESAVVQTAKSLTAEREEELPAKISALVAELDIASLVPATTHAQRPAPRQPQSTTVAGGAMPSIVVIIPETVLRRNPPDPAAETEIVRQLQAAGFSVIDQQNVNKVRYGDTVRKALNNQPEALSMLGRDLQADILVIGEAFAEEAEEVSANTSNFRARLELRAIRIADSKVLAAESIHASGMDITANIAAKKALEEAGRQLAPTLIEKLIPVPADAMDMQ